MRHGIMAVLAGIAILTPAAPLLAQAGIPDSVPGPNDILVQGKRLTKSSEHVEKSDWRVARTPHVVVFARANEHDIAVVAQNLEKLHFLLSVLLNRVDAPDDTIPIAVTIFGDEADFGQLDLRNTRSQQGPYPQAFPTAQYYDPRDDGAVMATTRTDQMIVIRQGTDLSSLSSLVTNLDGQIVNEFAGPTGAVDSSKVDRVAFTMTAGSRIYAGFARHYLQTYFPLAYPRWYLDGFGEIFADFGVQKDGQVVYGRTPEGFRAVHDYYGGYPVERVLDGRYLTDERQRWTPYDAWAMAHLLFFSEQWHQPLHDYLAAIARGEDNASAARALGDPGELQRAVSAYKGAKVPFERMTLPPDRIVAAQVYQLNRDEAASIIGRLQLGSHVTIPPEPTPGLSPKVADRLARERRDAIADREKWLAKTRDNADRYSDQLVAQLLLAEGECRVDPGAACDAAAERALALSPDDEGARGWKAVALIGAADRASPDARPALIAEARKMIARANRASPDDTLPLLAYYRSFADFDETVPELAIRGLYRASERVPNSPEIRLLLGEALYHYGDEKGARLALLPIANGPFSSPERPAAEQLLRRINGATGTP